MNPTKAWYCSITNPNAARPNAWWCPILSSAKLCVLGVLRLTFFTLSSPQSRRGTQRLHREAFRLGHRPQYASAYSHKALRSKLKKLSPAREGRPSMCTDRRDFLRLSAGIAGATLFGSSLAHADAEAPEPLEPQQGNQPEAVRRLRRMTDDVVPITLDERKGRIAKAQQLMREQRIDAIYLEPGSSMFYFTGMRWGTSERMFAAVIPAKGEIAWVCPKFEEE